MKSNDVGSTVFLLVIVFTIFGSAGIMFVRRGLKNMSQQDETTLDKIKITVNILVGGWFVFAVIVGIWLTITRLIL